MGHDTHEHQQEAPKVDPHQLKAAMIHELSPYYEGHDLSVVGKVQHYISHLIEGHHQANISTSGFKQQNLNEFSQRKQISRTVYALKKIKAFNPHFFTSDEEMILEPLPLGITTYGLKYGFAAFDAALLTYFWRNWNFNIKTAALFAGIVGYQIFTLQLPNITNEMFIQTPRRYFLAERYVKAYGPQLFHDIINPNYDLDSLRHLQNKLNPN